MYSKIGGGLQHPPPPPKKKKSTQLRLTNTHILETYLFFYTRFTNIQTTLNFFGVAKAVP